MKYTAAFLLLSLLFVGTTNSSAQKFGYKGFSGGMMINTGYVSGELIQNQKTGGAPFGFGGAIKIHLSDHFRVGSEGYVSTLNYNHDGSFASVGWGGGLVDWFWQLGKFAPFTGVCIGGGSFKNLTLNDPITYRKYSFMAITPFAGVEFALTDKVRLIFKTDYLFNVTSRQSDFLRGVRFFIGFSFYRLKS